LFRKWPGYFAGTDIALIQVGFHFGVGQIFRSARYFYTMKISAGGKPAEHSFETRFESCSYKILLTLNPNGSKKSVFIGFPDLTEKLFAPGREEFVQRYQDRTEAGWGLAVHFAGYFRRPEVMVLALSRGSVLVAYEIAQALGALLDVFLPGEDSETPASDDVTISLQQARYYRSGRAPLNLRDKIAILVDDGFSKASTVKAAAKAARQQKPEKVIIAIPALTASFLEDLHAEVDRMVGSVSPKPFQAAGFLYENEREPTDQEIRNLIDRAARQRQAATASRAHRR